MKKEYSFSGENEYISVSNGVIILDGKEEICYGGDLKVMSDNFSDITTYSTTIYINGSEKETLLSNSVDDQTGETIDVSGNIGKISGDVLRDSDDKLTDNLWFELKTTNLSGEENTWPHRRMQQKRPALLSWSFGPSGESRTHGLLNPIQARYQTAPHPEIISAENVCYFSQTTHLHMLP